MVCLEVKLARIEARMHGLNAAQHIVAETGQGGRVKKGLSKKLIADFLKASNGLGASIPQIVEAIGRMILEADTKEVPR